MRLFSRFLHLFFMLLCIWAPQWVQAALPVPAAPDIDAKSFLLIDFNSGHIIAGRDIDARLQPASLTKMMTAYIVYAELASGNLSRNDKVLVSEKAWRTGGSSMFIEVGEQVSVDDLIRGLIVQSGNDASVALAEAVAGNEQQFANYMNSYADKLGMTNSYFVNSTGLPDERHYSTARDMSLMAQALIRDFPEEYKLYAEREFTYSDIRQYNRNRLLWRDRTVDGIKTGHTEDAGYCLVASALRDDMRLISVLLGAKTSQSRMRETRRLLEHGFRFYKTQRVHAKHQVLESPRIWKGEADQLPLGLSDDLYITLPGEFHSTLKTMLQYDDNIFAPVVAGQVMGSLRISSNDQIVAERPLIALFDIDAGSFFQRALDSVLHYFQ